MARFRHVDQPEEPVVSVPPWPNYLLTLDEWAALPEDNMYYCELVEGTIQVCPRPTSDHQLAHAELRYQLRQQLADEFRCVPEVEVVATAFPQATVRTPTWSWSPGKSRTPARAGTRRPTCCWRSRSRPMVRGSGTT